MAGHTKEATIMTRSMATVSIFGLMEEHTSEIGRTENKTEKEFTFFQME